MPGGALREEGKSWLAISKLLGCDAANSSKDQHTSGKRARTRGDMNAAKKFAEQLGSKIPKGACLRASVPV